MVSRDHSSLIPEREIPSPCPESQKQSQKTVLQARGEHPNQQPLRDGARGAGPPSKRENPNQCSWSPFVAGRGTPSRAQKGFLSNRWKWIIRGDARADKARGFIGRGCPARQQQCEGTREDCSATWLPASGFMVMGFVSRLSLADHSDSEPFLVVLSH